jgi:ABC-type sugar transport system permease subunit
MANHLGNRQLWHDIKRSLPLYAFISPFFIIFGVFMLFPILFSIYLSLCSWNGIGNMKFVGWHNFVVLFNDTRFWNSIKVTGILVIVTVFFRTVCALLLACAMNMKLKLQKVFRAIFFLPTITSLVVISVVWQFIYNPYFGYLNHVLSWFGMKGLDWLNHPFWALPAIILVLIWAGIGYDMILYLAGLQGIPEDVYEAALVDGAWGFKRFWHITVPMLRPVTAFIITTGIINNLQMFVPMKIMTQGGPFFRTETIVYNLYENGFSYLKFGYASAIGLALFVLTMIISFGQIHLFGDEK